MPDNGERLTWYQRMMSSESIQEINQNANELQDLYGYVPGEIYELKRSISEHIAAKRWCISSLKDVKEGVLIQLHNENELSGFMIVLSQTFKKRFKPAEKERTFIVENASISEVADAILAGTMV
jgi:transcription-repair coupling factor (superfamily II helicase)